VVIAKPLSAAAAPADYLVEVAEPHIFLAGLVAAAQERCGRTCEPTADEYMPLSG